MPARALYTNAWLIKTDDVTQVKYFGCLLKTYLIFTPRKFPITLYSMVWYVYVLSLMTGECQWSSLIGW